MGNFWESFKSEWNKEWQRMEDMGNLPQNSDTETGSQEDEDNEDQSKKWELVYLKFREIKGRDPYSFQELVDWWNRA